MLWHNVSRQFVSFIANILTVPLLSSAYDQAGFCVSISADGSKLAVGARQNDENGIDAGQVLVYENLDGTWTQMGQNLNGEAEGDNFGFSLSLSENGLILAVGAPYNYGSGQGSGHVRVFEYQSDTWVQIGQDINGEAIQDYSGRSVSINSDGSVVVIGANYNDDNGDRSGHARVYENQDGTWMQIGQDIDGEAESDFCGVCVDINADGSIIAIAADGNDVNGNNSGHVRVYKYYNEIWTQIGQDIDGENGDHLGLQLSMNGDGSIIAVGARENENGHVQVYKNQSSIWTQLGQNIYGESDNDKFGSAVNISPDGSILAIGGYQNNENGINNSGHTRVYHYIPLTSSWTSSEQSYVVFGGTNNIQINTFGETAQIEIFDINGRLLNNTSTNGDESFIPVKETGLFIVKISNNEKTIIRKVVVN